MPIISPSLPLSTAGVAERGRLEERRSMDHEIFVDKKSLFRYEKAGSGFTLINQI